MLVFGSADAVPAQAQSNAIIMPAGLNMVSSLATALPAACPQQVAYFSTMKELTRSSERSLRNCKAAPDDGARSALGRERALAPVAQQQMAEQREQQEDCDAGRRDQYQGGKHARDLELVA